MQHLYTYFQYGSHTEKCKLELNNSIHDVYNAYIYVLLTIKEIANYSITDAENKKKKFLPSYEDLNVSTAISNSILLKRLFNSPTFINYINKNKSLSKIESDIETIETEYYKLASNPEYKAYCKIAEPSADDEKKIILLITKSLLNNSPLFDSYVSKFYINWQYDKPTIRELVFKTLKSNNPELKSLVKHPENIKFAIKLFELVTNNYKNYDETIASKTINWDFNRILLIDKVLLRMAISEFMNFETIPEKSTIDEYLTISKQFSSSKSYIFINGILDAILKDLNK